MMSEPIQTGTSAVRLVEMNSANNGFHADAEPIELRSGKSINSSRSTRKKGLAASSNNQIPTTVKASGGSWSGVGLATVFAAF